MAKAKKAGKTEQTQKERFIRAAIEAGVDKSGKDFERAFKKVVPRKKAKPTATRSRRDG